MDKTNLHYTPRPLARKLVELVEIGPDDVLLEPFKGDGAFYDSFPEANAKDWCEIDQGRDIFDLGSHEGVCDVIITNPPYKTNGMGQTVFIDWCLRKASKTVAVLLTVKAFNSLTPLRLMKWQEDGWSVSRIHVCSVKKWYGRCYFVVFDRSGSRFVTFDLNSF